MTFIRKIFNALGLGKGKANGGKFWSFVRCEDISDGDPDAELLLYGVIGDDGWWDDVTSRGFADELKALGDVSHIRVRINSPGGDIFAAQAIYTMLHQHSAKITVNIDGWAASAATIVAMAGDEIIMPGNTMMMIHNPWMIAMGDAREMRKTAEILDQARETIIAAYQSKTGMERQTLINLMNAETWMTAEEALEKGFVDTVTEPVRVAACAKGIYSIGGVEVNLKDMKVWPGQMLASAEDDSTSEQEDEETSESSSEIDALDSADEASSEGDDEDDSEADKPSQEAVDAERARLKAIDELAKGVVGAEDIVFRAKYEEPISAEQLAVKLIQSGCIKNAALLDARRKGAKAAEVPAGSTDVGSEASAKQAHVKRVAGKIKDRRGK